MKKIFAAMIIFVMFLLCSCGNQAGNFKREDYLEIINGTRTFTDESGNEVSLSDYQIPDIVERYVFNPKSYSYIDLDGDSAEEMVVSEEKQEFYLILFNGNDNKIHGCSLGARDLISLKNDGEFMQSSSAFISNTAKITGFNNNKPNIEITAEISEFENIYKVDEISSKEMTEQYFSQFNNKPDAQWVSLQYNSD